MRTFLLVWISLGILSSSAAEMEVRDSKLSVQAFGAFAVSKVTTSKVTSGLENPGNDLNFSRVTRFGLNVSYRYSEELEAFSQLMARRRPGREAAQLDLLVLNYHVNDLFSVRVGREILPIFLFSEQADIGVTYPWFEPPMETYPMNSIKSLEGARFTYRPESEENRFQFDFYAGSGQTKFESSTGAHVATYEPSLREGFGLNIEMESKAQAPSDFAYRVRLGALTGKVKLAVAAEADLGGGLTGRYFSTTDIGQLQLYTAGSLVKWMGTELISEYCLRQTKSPTLPRAAAIYGTLLHHFGNWSPNYTFFRVLDLEGSLRPHPDAALGVTTLLKSISFHAVGLNYQLDPSVLIKIQAMKYREEYEDSGYYINTYQGSVGADFVFF